MALINIVRKTSSTSKTINRTGMKKYFHHIHFTFIAKRDEKICIYFEKKFMAIL